MNRWRRFAAVALFVLYAAGTAWAIRWAYARRGYFAIGGEWALPLLWPVSVALIYSDRRRG